MERKKTIVLLLAVLLVASFIPACARKLCPNFVKRDSHFSAPQPALAQALPPFFSSFRAREEEEVRAESSAVLEMKEKDGKLSITGAQLNGIADWPRCRMCMSALARDVECA